MAYTVEIATSAAKAIRDMPRDVGRRLTAKAASLADDPRPHGVRKLRGADDLYRVRVGDYRLIYSIDDERLTVLVVKAADRKEAY